MASLPSLLNRFNIARRLPIFSKLNWFEVRRVARKSVIDEYKKGEFIRREGDPPDAFYCLVAGRLQAYTLTPSGRKENIEFLHRGMYFGIVSLMTGQNHSLNFEVINDAVILKILKDDFHEILKSIPQLAIEFSQSLSQRVRENVTQTKSFVESSIISIYSPVKGSGSSTYAINLALSLGRETNKRTIFVSIVSKLKKDAAIPTDVDEASPNWKKPALDLKDILHDSHRLKQCIIQGDLKIDLLNVVFDPQDVVSIKQISHFVSILTHDYRYVVVDLPNEMDEVVLTTLTQSDLVQLVILDRDEDLKMTKAVIGHLKETLKENFQSGKIQVIISGIQYKLYLSFDEVNKAIDYHVHTKLPHINRSELNVAVVSGALTVITPDPNSEYARTVTRIARRVGGVLVGIVLGGGAALGIAHVGVVKVLEEENIPIDIVVGSSMGALLASFWAIGYKAKDLEKVAREFETKKSLLRLVDLPISAAGLEAGLVGGHAIKRWLRSHLGDKTFYDTVMPLKIVAYDLIRREEMVLESGSLVEAIRRSIAIPGVIPPVQEKEKLIIDGGVLNPLPTNVLSRLGINKIIAVNVLQSPEHVAKGFELELKQLKEAYKVSFWKSPGFYIGLRLGKFFSPNVADIIVRTLQATEYVLAEQSGKIASIVIHPDLVGINWFELYRVDDLIKSGEEATRKVLPQLKALVKS